MGAELHQIHAAARHGAPVLTISPTSAPAVMAQKPEATRNSAFLSFWSIYCIEQNAL
ncbi:hypothetical protein [Pseudomonas sp. ML96]|uniref:hypothetical protein n=1 Tax=Pseudomonas sp. ML96 TaxID=1523503 RepID=UPI0012E00116|nr:hypothetical protein [Pseudomonas sp. ML96]